MTGVELEDFWCYRPGVADGLERGLPPERLEVLGEVAGRDEGEDVGFEAFHVGIMERPDGRLFRRFGSCVRPDRWSKGDTAWLGPVIA